MGTVTLLYFAQAAKLTGCERDECSVEGETTVALLRERILDRHPGLLPLAGSLRWAVDETLVEEDALVRPGQTVAVMPPFSGG